MFLKVQHIFMVHVSLISKTSNLIECTMYKCLHCRLRFLVHTGFHIKVILVVPAITSDLSLTLRNDHVLIFQKDTVHLFQLKLFC